MKRYFNCMGCGKRKPSWKRLIGGIVTIALCKECKDRFDERADEPVVFEGGKP